MVNKASFLVVLGLGLLFQQLMAFFFEHGVEFIGQIGQHVADIVEDVATSYQKAKKRIRKRGRVSTAALDTS